MVSFDGEGSLVADISFDKEVDELVYQSMHDALPGRLMAMRRLAREHPTNEQTLGVLSVKIDAPQFWADGAEAALLLGAVRTPAAGEVLARALRAEDYRIRKAAVLALEQFGPPHATSLLQDIVLADRHDDVVATAIVALARSAGKTQQNSVLRILRSQLDNDSWYDEIRIACMTAFGDLGDTSVIPILVRYAQHPSNQALREAAVKAWRTLAPNDRSLHRLLIQAAQSPPYALQLEAIEMLGELCVEEGEGLLRRLVDENTDANVATKANKALEQIERVLRQSKQR
jgi:HEAT repeat protein